MALLATVKAQAVGLQIGFGQPRPRAVESGTESGPWCSQTGRWAFAAASSSAGVVSLSAIRRLQQHHQTRRKGRSDRQNLDRRRGCRIQLCATATAGFDVAAWRKGWRDYKDLEGGFYFLEDIPGLPSDLKGSYFRNGPGKFSVANVPVRHQLDGDGVILGISFDGEGRVCVRHRLVQTQGHLREQKAQRVVSNGAYGTQAWGGLPFDTKKFRSKNTANSGCFWWKDKLMALWTYGKPHLIEPGSLGTQIGAMDSGATDLGGTVEAGLAFGDRPRIFENSLQAFSQFPTPLSTTVTFFDYRPDSWNPRYMKPRNITLDGYANVQDFGSTKRWFFVISPPLKLLDTVGAALGKAANEVLEFDLSGKSQLIFATRTKDDGEEVRIDLDEAISCNEIVNSYELEDGSVVFDAVVADRWDFGRPSSEDEPPRWETEDPAQWPRSRLVRYEVNLKSQAVQKKPLVDRHVGNVSVNPTAFGERHKFVYYNMAHSEDSAGPYGGIGKVSVDSGEVCEWVATPTQFVGEPMFIARSSASSEDDGYLLSVIFDGATEESEVVILDAKTVSAGPICRFKLKEAVPHGLRGCWVGDLFFTEEEMKRKIVLLRMFQRKSQTWNEMKTSFSLVGGNPFFDKQGGKLR